MVQEQVLAGVKAGCVHLRAATLCDPVWHMSPRSSEMEFY